MTLNDLMVSDKNLGEKAQEAVELAKRSTNAVSDHKATHTKLLLVIPPNRIFKYPFDSSRAIIKINKDVLLLPIEDPAAVEINGGSTPVSPSPVPSSTSSPYAFWFGALTGVITASLVAAALYFFLIYKPAPTPPEPPTSAATAIGRAYGPILASDYATAWEAGASSLDGGKSIGDSLKDVSTQFESERIKTFNDKISPGLNSIQPEGTEPTDPLIKTKMSKYWRDLAAGLRKTK